jgi:hypothetical protein
LFLDAGKILECVEELAVRVRGIDVGDPLEELLDIMAESRPGPKSPFNYR